MGNFASRALGRAERRDTIRAVRGPLLRRQQTVERPEQKKRRNDRYQRMLDRAADEVADRVEENACPREKLMNFKVLGYLTRGGFGCVFMVEHRATQIKYALKVLEKQQYRHPYHVQMVIYEKQLLYAFKNPFIIEAVYAFQDWKNCYLVMELATHGDLARLVGMTNSLKTLKYFTAQMILGIEYIHACKIIHRDLKPGNVFIAKDLYLRIGDFGFAKRIRNRTYTVCGTVPYKAPEMFRSRGYGRGIDWWALGIILYKLLYVKNPFAEDDWDDDRIADSVLNTGLAFPLRADPNAAHNIFIAGLLDKDYSQRLGSNSGGVDAMKEHEWFKDVSFFDVFEKKITLSPGIDPVEPRPKAMYDFMPKRRSGDVPKNQFEGF